MTEIYGHYDARFEAVADAMRNNLLHNGDIGASVAVVHKGEMVVDIWGGYTDPEQTDPWQENTIVNVWSTTKTMMAISALVLADRGEIDMFRPVADYWPEFAANGKGQIEVRHLMSHTSGLSGWAEPITMQEVCDWEKSTAMLAAQEPWWEPGTASGYHMLNQGHLVGEVIRRVTGQSIGTFFAEEIAKPLNADFHIGLNEEEFHRVSNVIYPPDDTSDQLDIFQEAMEQHKVSGEVAMKTFMNPAPDANAAWTDWWRKAEVPAANGHGNARSVATIQALVSNGGEMNGKKLLSEETIDMIFQEQSNGLDLVLFTPLRFGIGYGLPVEEFPFLPTDGKVCFWGGWGGSLVVNDVDNNLTISYMMNRMLTSILGDERGASVVEATYQAL
jgi:CubicO group peptidase (beta-lactamase class C family)